MATSRPAVSSPAGAPAISNALGRRERFRIAIALVVLGAVALIAYHNTFSVPFLLDDLPAIVFDNATIKSLWPLWNVLAPPATVGVGGRPLLNLSFALNYAAGGTNVFGYHAVNLAIHVAAAFALFGVVRRTLQLPALRARFGAASTALAFGVALLWVSHPVQTETVTYVSQRSEALAAWFYFAVLYGFIRSVDAPVPRRWQAVAVVSCFLGTLSKETIATVPFAVLLFDRTFVAGNFRAAWQRRRAFYLALAVPWLVFAWSSRDLSQRGIGFTYSISAWNYALTSCRSLVHYLRLTVWPHPLVFDYGSAFVRRASDVIPQASLVLGLLAGTIVLLRSRPKAGFLAAWFFLTLALTTSFVPVAFQPMAEHRLYLPLAGLCAVFVLAVYAWLNDRAIALVTVLAAAGTMATISRNHDYRSELFLWSDTAEKYPGNSRAHSTLGAILAETGRVEDGRRELETALRLNPDDLDAHLNLGNAFLLIGRAEDAVPHYEIIVRTRPDFAEGRYNLGNALLTVGRKEAAIGEFEAAAKLTFNSPELHHRLGEVFLRLRRLPDAIRQYRVALENEGATPAPAEISREADSHQKLAMLLSESGAIAEAVPHLQAALRLQPNDADTHNDLGVALSQLGQFAAAREAFETALRLNPNQEIARRNLQRLPH